MLLTLLVLVVTIWACLIAYLKRKQQYWKDRGLPYIEPTLPFGNFENPFRRKLGLGRMLKSWYDHFKKQGHKHGGVYFFVKPFYLPVDLDNIKNIMTKDFAHFTDRGTFYDEKNDPLSAHLFAIGGAKWRNLRVKLTPTFTTGKMKLMFETMIQCSRVFKELMDTTVAAGGPIDIKDVTSRFTTDVIGSCAFGLECQSVKDEESPFRKYGSKLFQRSGVRAVLTAVAVTYPSLGRALGFRFFPEDTAKFFMDLVTSTVEYREKQGCRRNDFMQILMDLKNNKMEGVEHEEHDGKSLTIEEVAAQCVVFFIAGYETSSTLMSFALLELSLNQDAQERAREEVKQVLERHGGQITYDALGELKYMQQVMDEALRMHPPVPFITRECVKEYVIPDTDIVMQPGTRAWISVLGIHHDEEYYPHPEKFDPDRFSEENRPNIPHYAHIPFGEGPRICIGIRFGLMQAKIGLSVLLSNYKFTVHPKTELPIQMDPTVVITSVKGGIWLKAEKL